MSKTRAVTFTPLSTDSCCLPQPHRVPGDSSALVSSRTLAGKTRSHAAPTLMQISIAWDSSTYLTGTAGESTPYLG